MAVTVYQPNALVTREVDVPEGAGVMELVVTPLPEAANEGTHRPLIEGVRHPHLDQPDARGPEAV